jgi:hypothetical protein
MLSVLVCQKQHRKGIGTRKAARYAQHPYDAPHIMPLFHRAGFRWLFFSLYRIKTFLIAGEVDNLLFLRGS